MIGIITALQKFRQDSYADIAKCSTLEHFAVPHGKQSTLIDYKGGFHHASFFTGHDTEGKYSIPGTISPGTALSGGNLVDLSTNNFIALLVGYFDNGATTFQLGDSTTNGYLQWSGGGGIKGAGGSAALAFAMNPDLVQGRALIRSGTASTQLFVDGSSVDSDNTTNVGSVLLDDDIGSLFIDQFYGLVIFKFNGSLPSDYVTVLNEIIADLKNGNHRLPKAVESWA